MATSKNRRGKKAASIAVDFSDTESSGVVPEDDYVFEVSEVTKETSDNSGADYLSWKLEISEGEYKGRHLFHNTSLQPQALFNLRAVLEALGYDVPQGAMDIDLDDLVGERGACSVIHEEYKGKTKARPAEFFTEEELENRGEGGGKEEKEEKPTKAASKKTKVEKEEPVATKKKAGGKKKAEPEFEVGNTVKFTDDEGDEREGEITEIDGDDYTVRVGKGKKAEEFTLEADDMEMVEAE